MKKLVVTTAIALLALSSIAAAQSQIFSKDLQVGSTGADVSALQTWLINHGYSIPSIASGTRGSCG